MKEINKINYYDIDIPDYKYTIRPFSVDDVIYQLEERPNVWIRFWMWIFFNWRFKLI